MSDAPSAAIAANVILRYLLQDHPELTPKATALFDAIHAGRTSVTCDPVTLAEVAFVLASFYKVPPTEIVSGLEPVVKPDGFRIPEKALYLKAPGLNSGEVARFMLRQRSRFRLATGRQPRRSRASVSWVGRGTAFMPLWYDTAATREEYHVLYVFQGITPDPSRHLTPSARLGCALR